MFQNALLFYCNFINYRNARIDVYEDGGATLLIIASSFTKHGRVRVCLAGVIRATSRALSDPIGQGGMGFWENGAPTVR